MTKILPLVGIFILNVVFTIMTGFYLAEGSYRNQQATQEMVGDTPVESNTKFTPIEVNPISSDGVEVVENEVEDITIDLSSLEGLLDADTIDSLDSTAFIRTGTALNADLLDSVDSSSFLRSDSSDDASGAITFTASPGGSSVGGGPVYINPSSISSSDYTLLGLAVGGTEKIRADGNGNFFTVGRVGASKYCIGGTENDCASTFAAFWSENSDDDYIYISNELYTLGNSVADGENKLPGLYLGDGSPLTFGTSNDATALFSSGELQINLNNNDFSIDNDLLYFDSSARRIGVDTTTPDAPLDVEDSIITDTYKIRSTTDVAYTIAGGYDSNEFYIPSFRLGAAGATSARIESGTTSADLTISAGTLNSLVFSGANGGGTSSSVKVSVNPGNWSATRAIFEVDGTWTGNGGSWNGNVYWHDISPTINTTNGGASSAYRALNINVTETSLPPGQNYLAWIGTNSNPLFTITNTGNVAIGAAVPDTDMKLDVEGRVQVNLAGTQTSTALCGSHSGGTGASVDDVEIVDCTGTPAADYMEMYPVEPNTEKGTVVAIGNTKVTTTDGDEIQQLVKTSTEYQKNVLGVVSDSSKAGDFNSIGYNIKGDDNPMPIALSGRVPVKIASYSESIAPGDYLTTSNEPGRAMKATGPGPIIGKALQTWSVESQKDSIMMFVSNSYSGGL